MVPLRFVIRTNCSFELGMGHFNRCCVLTEELRKIGQEAVLLVNSDADAKMFVVSKGVPVQFVSDDDFVNDWPEADACIVDLYQYDDQYYGILKSKYQKIIIFDDIRFHVPLEVSAVINNNIYANASDYPSHIKCFVGPMYYLLRQEFFGKHVLSDAQNVLVSMGGSDPEGQTMRIVEILLEITSRHINVVFGSGKPIENLGAILTHPQVTFYTVVSKISLLMERAAYCVSGAGSMIYELIYMGVPIACFSLSKNQRLIAKTLSAMNALLYLGHYNEIKDSIIYEKLKGIDVRKDSRERMVKNATGLIDEKGSGRLAQELTNWVYYGKAEI